MLEDVFAREAPMPPAEIADLVKSLEIQGGRYRVTFRKLSDT